MLRFADLKIVKKLTLSFGLFFALLIAITTFGTIVILRSNSTQGNITKHQIPALKVCLEVPESVRTIQRDIRDGLILRDAAGVAKWTASYDTAAKKLSDEVKEYASLATSPEEIQKADALKADDAAWQPIRDQVASLATSKQYADSTKVLYGADYKKTRTELEKSASDALDLQTKSTGLISKTAEAQGSAAITSIMCISIIAIVVGVISSIAMTRGITGPLAQLSEKMTSLSDISLAELSVAVQALAEGDLTATFFSEAKPLAVTSKDEFGAMAKTYNGLVDRIKETTQLFSAAQTSLRRLIGQISETAQSVDSTSEKLTVSSNLSRTAANSITSSVRDVATAADQSAKTSSDMASGSDSQARCASDALEAMTALESAVAMVQNGGSLQQTAAVQADIDMTKADQAVTELTESAQQMARTSLEAASIAKTGGQAVEQTIISMGKIKEQVEAAALTVKELGTRGQEIGAIIETIDQIASQTNLLALNAAIEAARAGEHGRGFAVVADEVRKLAERATQATKEISSLITSVITGVEASVSAMEHSRLEVQQGSSKSSEAGVALGQILTAANQVASQVEAVKVTAQRMASTVESVKASVTTVREIAEGNEKAVSDMANGARTVSDAITTVASISQETAAGAEEMSASAQEVSASTSDVASAIKDQAHSIEQVSIAATELRNMASEVLDMLGKFTWKDQQVAGQASRYTGDGASKIRRAA